MSADYYATLGVSKDVDANELKRAYHKAAMKWHPVSGARRRAAPRVGGLRGGVASAAQPGPRQRPCPHFAHARATPRAPPGAGCCSLAVPAHEQWPALCKGVAEALSRPSLLLLLDARAAALTPRHAAGQAPAREEGCGRAQGAPLEPAERHTLLLTPVSPTARAVQGCQRGVRGAERPAEESRVRCAAPLQGKTSGGGGSSAQGRNLPALSRPTAHASARPTPRTHRPPQTRTARRG